MLLCNWEHESVLVANDGAEKQYLKALLFQIQLKEFMFLPFGFLDFGCGMSLRVLSYCCWGLSRRPFSGACGKPGQRGHESTTDGRWWSHTSRDFSQTGRTSSHLWSVSEGREFPWAVGANTLGEKVLLTAGGVSVPLSHNLTVLLPTEKLKPQDWWCSGTLWSRAAIGGPSVQSIWARTVRLVSGAFN